MEEDQVPANPTLRGCAYLFMAFPVIILVFLGIVVGPYYFSSTDSEYEAHCYGGSFQKNMYGLQPIFGVALANHVSGSKLNGLISELSEKFNLVPFLAKDEDGDSWYSASACSERGLYVDIHRTPTIGPNLLIYVYRNEFKPTLLINYVNIQLDDSFNNEFTKLPVENFWLGGHD